MRSLLSVVVSMPLYIFIGIENWPYIICLAVLQLLAGLDFKLGKN